MLQTRPRVALFVTCLVDLHRPTIGFAAIKLLEQAGCQVEVPRAQTCCGQPAYNSGDRATTREIAYQVLEAFSGYDYVVVPSGSCGGMSSRPAAERLHPTTPVTQTLPAIYARPVGTPRKPCRRLARPVTCGDPGPSAPTRS